ncbi:MAG: outer membrane protein assembly factor BamE [Planctomycetes bacterium]|nr:outer membrane protein assembly factor BamE [Planctomycetota bacterium]
MRRLLLASLLCLVCACAVGRSAENVPLDAEKLHRLQPGTSTSREVVELLGAPVDVVQLGKRSAYLYQFTSTKTAALILLVANFYNSDQRADRAWVFFDENQILSHVGVTLAGGDTEYAMPWEDVHHQD